MSNYGEFINKKMRQHERIVARHEKLGTSPSWRMRLRIRLASKLNTDAKELKAEFCGRRIVITSRTKGEPLNQAEWIVIIAKRFISPEAAVKFGLNLQSAISAVSAVRSIPVDVGFDNIATTSFGDVVKDAVAKTGAWLVDDVHGVDVYPDAQTAIVLALELTATSSLDPSRIVGPLQNHGRRLTRLDDKGREATLLINAAFMAPHPVAIVTLAVAAVELLAADERWNAKQKKWIIGLRAHLEDSEDLSSEERGELRRAIDGLSLGGCLKRSGSTICSSGGNSYT
jgi:hypothetical protein